MKVFVIIIGFLVSIVLFIWLFTSGLTQFINCIKETNVETSAWIWPITKIFLAFWVSYIPAQGGLIIASEMHSKQIKNK